MTAFYPHSCYVCEWTFFGGDNMSENERWQRVNELMNAALDKPTSEREAWLRDACGDDSALFDEVFSLLAFDAEKTGDVRGSIEALAGDLSRSSESTYVGVRAGQFRITKKLAEGGMGTVFLGERADQQYEQRVAIKLLPHHRLDAVSSQRFVDERRILAGLEHPNIARLIDGGSLSDGVPYIVMEFVDGQPIDSYCRDQQLHNDAIIELVSRVCDAVGYAHRKLVIHRDIKPGNILVNDQGVPKLLDFGIAKLLDPAEVNPELTRAENRALTPMYASPEQIEGLPITTAADVYGLGLLLYRLLTGQMPYAPTGPTPRELENAILSQTPERPSTVVVSGEAGDARWQRRQQRALRGELDTILLTALRKDPERRYNSVAALRDDLQRFREHRPILARGDSPFYVLGKFLYRQRLPVGLTAAALLTGLLTVNHYTNQLEIERDTAQETAAFLQELFEARNPYLRNKEGLTVETLLEEGIDKLESDDSLSPLVRARLLTTISQVLQNLGRPEKANEMVTEAITLVERAEGDSAAELFNPLRILMRLRIVQAQYDEAGTLGERLNAIAVDAYGEQSPQSAQATHMLWLAAYRRGDYDAMNSWGEKTYAIRKAIYAPDDMAIAAGSNALGITYWRQDELGKASEFYEESARVLNAQTERNDMQYASLLHNLGLVYNDSGRYEKAIETYRESIAIHKSAGSEDGPMLPLTMYALAHSLDEFGDDIAAHQTYMETVVRQAAVAGPETHMVAYALTGHGMFLESIGAPELAGPILDEANRIFGVVFDEPHNDQAATWVGMGYVAMREGAWDKARELMERALAMREENDGVENPSTVRTRNALGRLAFERGDYSAAADTLQQAISLFEAGDHAEHPFAVDAYAWLGRTRLAQGQAAQAVSLLQKAVDLGEIEQAPSHVANVRRRLWLAEARVAAGEAEAEDQLQEARGELAGIQKLWQKALSDYPVPTVEELLNGETA